MSDYKQWMNKVQKSVTITLCPTTAEYLAARAEYEALTGTDNTYEHPEVFQKIIEPYYKNQVHENISLNQAQILAEPIRIANPDDNVNITSGEGEKMSFIGNTSWADQMSMFWEYETYTPEGAKLAAARKAECDALGKVASWE